MMFKNDHTIEIMVSKDLKGKAPPEWGKPEWKQYYKTFKKYQMSPRQLAANIWQGYAFIPVYKNGRRLIENLTAVHHMAFDFDNNGASLDHLMRNGSVGWTFASFAYSTPSSTKSHPKSRVVFCFNEPITSAEKTKKLYQALAHEFKLEGSVTDPACKDPLRLYYGSENCQLIGNWSIVTNETIDFFIDRYEQEHIPPEPSPAIDTIEFLPPDESRIKRRIYNLLDKIAAAQDGEKHTTLNKQCFVLGGYVAGGYLSQSEAEVMATQAITSNSGVKNMKAAVQTIETAVRDGMSKPLIIEKQRKKPLSEIL